jgi:hypothetical protein
MTCTNASIYNTKLLQVCLFAEFVLFSERAGITSISTINTMIFVTVIPRVMCEVGTNLKPILYFIFTL